MSLPNHLSNIKFNNFVVITRGKVKQVLVRMCHKMTQEINKYRNSKADSEEVISKKKKKANRLTREMKIMKKLKKDDITKFAVQFDKKPDSILNDVKAHIKLKVLVKISQNEILKKSVADFRQKYPNWKVEIPNILRNVELKKTGMKLNEAIEKGESDRLSKYPEAGNEAPASIGKTKVKKLKKSEESKLKSKIKKDGVKTNEVGNKTKKCDTLNGWTVDSDSKLKGTKVKQKKEKKIQQTTISDSEGNEGSEQDEESGDNDENDGEEESDNSEKNALALKLSKALNNIADHSDDDESDQEYGEEESEEESRDIGVKNQKTKKIESRIKHQDDSDDEEEEDDDDDDDESSEDEFGEERRKRKLKIINQQTKKSNASKNKNQYFNNDSEEEDDDDSSEDEFEEERAKKKPKLINQQTKKSNTKSKIKNKPDIEEDESAEEESSEDEFEEERRKRKMQSLNQQTKKSSGKNKSNSQNWSDESDSEEEDENDARSEDEFEDERRKNKMQLLNQSKNRNDHRNKSKTQASSDDDVDENSDDEDDGTSSEDELEKIVKRKVEQMKKNNNKTKDLKSTDSRQNDKGNNAKLKSIEKKPAKLIKEKNSKVGKGAAEEETVVDDFFMTKDNREYLSTVKPNVAPEQGEQLTGEFTGTNRSERRQSNSQPKDIYRKGKKVVLNNRSGTPKFSNFEKSNRNESFGKKFQSADSKPKFSHYDNRNGKETFGKKFNSADKFNGRGGFNNSNKFEDRRSGGKLEGKPQNTGAGTSEKLHPSWEAKKRHQPAITHFKGKKIKFDE